MSKQAVNYLLGQLERLGYLKRVPDPDDLRSKRVALTARGVSAVGVIREAVGEMETVWERRLGAKRFDQLRGLLVDLNQPRVERPNDGCCCLQGEGVREPAVWWPARRVRRSKSLSTPTSWLVGAQRPRRRERRLASSGLSGPLRAGASTTSEEKRSWTKWTTTAPSRPRWRNA